MKVSSRKMPPRCPSCGADSPFSSTVGTVEQEFRHETFTVEASYMACSECQFKLLASGQVDLLRRKTADAYRVEHGLLTSSELRELRTTGGYSQKQFADRVGVGVASIKRWEHSGVQDQSNDKLLRQVKAGCDRLKTSLRDYESLLIPSWSVGTEIDVPSYGSHMVAPRDHYDDAGQTLWSGFASASRPNQKKECSDADIAVAA